VGTWLGIVAVAVAGVVLGVLLGGRISAEVGPFEAHLAVTPALTGGTDVAIPPLGSLHLYTHAGPAHLAISLDTLDQKRVRAFVNEPDGLTGASNTAVEDLRGGILRLVFQVAGVAVLGAMAAAAVVYRSMRRTAICGGLSLAVLAVTALISFATFRPDAIEEPHYEGLLTNAPAVIGDARRIAGQYEQYRIELQRLVQNVGRLYGVTSALPAAEPNDSTTRVLHISDMHLNPAGWSVVQTVVQQFHIGLVIDTGDITDWGSTMESSYVANIGALKVPYVFIRGNHDSYATAAEVARQPNATVLDDSAVTIDGLLIAGIGDPRFTPDKSAPGNDPAMAGMNDSVEAAAGRKLAASFPRFGRTPDIALVHEPAAAGTLAGRYPLVLAGHLHKRSVSRLDSPTDAPANAPHTLLMVQGSTGGAGLRGLESKVPTPLGLSVLYFDHARTLQAYDDITVGGTGQTEVTLQRHIVTANNAAGTPSPSAS
jgi:predicted phosphodiesterase